MTSLNSLHEVPGPCPVVRADALQDSAPSYLLRDRDTVYGYALRQRVRGMRIGDILTALHSPWQNPFAARLIGSIRRECLNHVLVLDERAPLVAVFVGATLTTTSVRITARVLADLGRLQDAAAKVVLGAAVVDDILGLIILAVVTGIAQTGRVSLAAVGLLSAKAVVFLVVAILAGIRLAPTLSLS